MKIIQCWRLPRNGIPVFYQPDQASHTVSAFVKVGGASDPPGVFEGRSHTFEHIAANRTQGLLSDEVQALLRTYSGHHWREAGIWTTYMSTSYGCGLLRRRDYILDLFPVFAQMVTNPIITEEILQTERSAVLTEWALHGKDDIGDRLSRRLEALIYRTNPVLMRMDCNPDHLMAPEALERLKRFHNEQYVASNIGAVILGPDRKTTKRMLKKAFGDLPPKEAPAIPFDTSDTRPYLTEVKRDEFEYGDKEQKCFHLLMGFPTDVWGNPLDDATDILAETLEFLLEDKLRDQNTDPRLGTYHPRVWTERTKFHGMFYIWIPTISFDGAGRAEDTVRKLIRQIRDGRVLDFLFERAKIKLPATKEREAGLKILKRILGKGMRLTARPIVDAYIDAFITQPQVLAELIIEHYCNGGVAAVTRKLNKFRAELRKVTKHSVVEAANEFLDPERYAVVLAKPIEPLDFNRFRRPDVHRDAFYLFV